MRLVRLRSLPPKVVLPEYEHASRRRMKYEVRSLLPFFGFCFPVGGRQAPAGKHGVVDAAEDRARTRVGVRLAPADTAAVEGGWVRLALADTPR